MATHQRALLLKLTSERKLSPNIQREISLIIKYSRETQGHEQAEKTATEITQIIEQNSTEEAIIRALNKKYPTRATR